MVESYPSGIRQPHPRNQGDEPDEQASRDTVATLDLTKAHARVEIALMINRVPRIILDPDVMGGKPCIRGPRVTVGTVVGLVASGRTTPEILAAYPYLEEDDIREALSYAAWRVEETEVPLGK